MENSLKTKGFSFSLWIKSNYQNFNEFRFYLLYIKAPDNKIIAIFLEKSHLFLHFLDNPPLQLTNILFNDGFWHLITITFTLQGTNLTEFAFFLDGNISETRILNSSYPISNEIFDKNTQILIGFDLLNYTKLHEDGSSHYKKPFYLKIAGFRMFSKAITPYEANLLFCITDNRGIVNFFSDLHDLNWPLLSFSNLKFFEMSQNRKENKSQVLFTKLQVLTKTSSLSQSLLIECDFRNRVFIEGRDLKSEIAKNPIIKGVLCEGISSLVLNTANDGLLAQAFIINEGRKLANRGVIKEFEKKRGFLTRSLFYLLERSDFILALFDILDKSENKQFFHRINRLFLDLLERSEFLSERFEGESFLYKSYIEIIKKKADFYEKSYYEGFLSLFCKKVNNSNKSLNSSNMNTQTYYWLINSLKIGREILNDTDFYQEFLGTITRKAEFIDIVIITLIDSSKNLFSK